MVDIQTKPDATHQYLSVWVQTFMYNSQCTAQIFAFSRSLITCKFSIYFSLVFDLIAEELMAFAVKLCF